MATRCNCPKSCKNSSAVDEKSKTMMVANGITSGLRRRVGKTHAACSQLIHIGLAPDGRGVSVRFGGGCRGNTTGICSTVKDGKATEVKQRLGGAKRWNPGNKLPGSACPGSRGHELLNKCCKQQGPSDRDFCPAGPVVYCRAI